MSELNPIKILQRAAQQADEEGKRMVLDTIYNAIMYLELGVVQPQHRGVAHLWAHWPVEDS